MPAVSPSPLSLEQGQAIEQILKFLRDPTSRIFVLGGYAGTGKTFCIRQLADITRGRLIFTAPTNKATKVLRDTLTSDAYKPECRTIYSLLGLRLEANGEVKELSIPEDPVDLSKFSAVVVDEGSMVSSKLFSFIRRAADDQEVKFIFLGDPAQLPPVGEVKSPIWASYDKGAELTQVRRHDNDILAFATAVRKVVDQPFAQIPFNTYFKPMEGDEGVLSLVPANFSRKIFEAAGLGHFSKPNGAKVIAWRNVTVDDWNKQIRECLFSNAAESKWLPSDRVILTEPAKGLDNQFIATTDDEGVITGVDSDIHPVWREFRVWNLRVTLDDNTPITLRVLHESSKQAYLQKVESLASAARANGKKWKEFWEFKEAFHSVRHAYAITAHRAQGSTYETAFVNWRDILLNPNRPEAYRCLYVAATRPKYRLFLG